jgi:hypothetical protein
MKTPNVIYLIDMGDEIAWCDDPNPSGECAPDDSIAYVKKEQRDELLELLTRARFYVAEYAKRSDMADETLLNIDRAIAKAKG